MARFTFSLLLTFVFGLLLGNCTLPAQETLAPALTPEPEPIGSQVNGKTSVPKSAENAVPAFRNPMTTAMPSVPESWQTFTDTLGRFTFEFPIGWHATPTLVDGVVLLDDPDRQHATRWVELWPAENPEQASIAVWIAENGLPWPGQVTQQQEDWINEVPVLRQRLENQDPNSGGPYVYALVWWPLGDHLLLWTAWPGDDGEMLDLLERMIHAFRDAR